MVAKKHVLCEKPVAMSSAELRSLLTLARENGVFFMEAMWTRFQPLAYAFKRVLEEGRLGPPVTLHADLSHDFNIEGACVTCIHHFIPHRTERHPDEPQDTGP